eukprot:scaffold20109_cov143-Isochrysis_galbana.AAC.1
MKDEAQVSDVRWGSVFAYIGEISSSALIKYKTPGVLRHVRDVCGRSSEMAQTAQARRLGYLLPPSNARPIGENVAYQPLIYGLIWRCLVQLN